MSISRVFTRYGDGVGMYRTHLFGEPMIIACTPSANKMVLQSESSFPLKWTNEELVGSTSLVAVEGDSHTRVRGLVVRAINLPNALREITLIVQPRITASLKSWSHRGRITVCKEAKKVQSSVEFCCVSYKQINCKLFLIFAVADNICKHCQVFCKLRGRPCLRHPRRFIQGSSLWNKSISSKFSRNCLSPCPQGY